MVKVRVSPIYWAALTSDSKRFLRRAYRVHRRYGMSRDDARGVAAAMLDGYFLLRGLQAR